MKKPQLLIGAASENSDIRYLTGLETPDAFVCIKREERCFALLSALEFDKGRKRAKCGVSVLRAGNYGRTFVEQIAAWANEWHCRSFDVPFDFPLGMAELLRESGLTVTPVKKTFLPEREFKTAAEVVWVTSALRSAEKGMMRAVRIIADSSVDAKGRLIFEKKILTSERLRTEIEVELLRHGTTSGETIASCGPHSAMPHHRGTGPIFANRPIVIDIFPRSLENGYFGDLTRTLVKGRFAPCAKEAFCAVIAARELAKTLIRAGAIPADIHEAAAREMEKRGFATGFDGEHNFGFFHGLGHGVGLEIHESPRLGPKNRTALSGGEIVTDEPGLYYPEWGGIRMEDMVLVEEKSCRTLTQIADYGEID